jgi:hypothetical protein
MTSVVVNNNNNDSRAGQLEMKFGAATTSGVAG